MQRLSQKKRALPTAEHEAGFTIIEILITTFIIGTVVTGMFGLFLLSLRGSQTAERRVAGIALANERMEMIRNLPYLDVGTLGGVPSGSILQSETVTRNGTPYIVDTDIRYVDDPYDGLITDGLEGKSVVCHSPPGNPGGQATLVIGTPALPPHLAHGDTEGPCPGDSDPTGADSLNTDYKQARVSVSWPSQYNISPVLLVTQIAPQGVEGGDATGTLDLTVLDALGNPVVGATVRLANQSVSPTIDITSTTNSFGRYVLPGLTESAQTYELHVTGSDYTTEMTYGAPQTITPVPSPPPGFVPASDYTHLTMIAREVTEKTFFIDTVAQLTIETDQENPPAPPVPAPGVAYTIRGTKTIGVDASADPVYKVEEAGLTVSPNTFVHSNLDWDSYTMTVDGPATGLVIKETSVVMPFVLNPGDDSTVEVTLVDHTASTLHVTVVDQDNAPVDNATVQLTGNGFDDTLGTGVYGQVLFEDLPVDGDYTLDVSAPGFSSLQQPATVAGNSAATVQLNP
ncbi:hypothetical protein CL628_03270 [bacterium]|nr:hypothetical protein [bacterium]